MKTKLVKVFTLLLAFTLVSVSSATAFAAESSGNVGESMVVVQDSRGSSPAPCAVEVPFLGAGYTSTSRQRATIVNTNLFGTVKLGMRLYVKAPCTIHMEMFDSSNKSLGLYSMTVPQSAVGEYNVFPLQPSNYGRGTYYIEYWFNTSGIYYSAEIVQI